MIKLNLALLHCNFYYPLFVQHRNIELDPTSLISSDARAVGSHLAPGKRKHSNTISRPGVGIAFDPVTTI